MASRDTSVEVERSQLELLRGRTTAERARMALEMSATVASLARRAWLRRLGDEREALLAYVAATYGSDMAERLRTHLEARDR
jgi:hypothetical protein